MNERLSRLLDQFRKAEDAVDASQASLRRRSAKRLDEILALSAQERLQALRDPALTEFDRGQLEHSLQNELPARRLRFARTATSPSLIWRFVRYHRRACLRSALAIAPLAWFGAHAVMATPARATLVELKVPFKVEWAMPGGYRQKEDLTADSDQIWVVENGHGRLRKWVYGQGYALSGPVPDSFLTDQLIVRRTP